MVDPQIAAANAAAIVSAGNAIGAGLAMTGMIGAGIGVGNIFGNFLSGALRNPSAASSQTATLFIGMALAEALGIFSFLVALLLMFAVGAYLIHGATAIAIAVGGGVAVLLHLKPQLHEVATRIGDADFKAVKASYRKLAKELHPDLKPDDKEAARQFHTIQAAYDVLRKAEERKTGAKV